MMCLMAMMMWLIESLTPQLGQIGLGELDKRKNGSGLAGVWFGDLEPVGIISKELFSKVCM